MISIYPGSFDPITFGHLDIINRGSKLFDRVIVVVAINPGKSPLFTVTEREDLIRQSIQHLPNVEVDSFDGLIVNYARKRNAHVLLRGLRAISDFEKELQTAHINHTFCDAIETVFLATSNDYSFLSSSAVREIARFGGDVSRFVPPSVALALTDKFHRP